MGLSQEVVNKCFVGSASRIGGSSFRVLAAEALARHSVAYSARACDNKLMASPGFFHWRSGGEKHINDPLSIANLQVICSKLPTISLIEDLRFVVFQRDVVEEPCFSPANLVVLCTHRMPLKTTPRWPTPSLWSRAQRRTRTAR